MITRAYYNGVRNNYCLIGIILCVYMRIPTAIAHRESGPETILYCNAVKYALVETFFFFFLGHAIPSQTHIMYSRY